MISIQEYIFEHSNTISEVDLKEIAKDILEICLNDNRKVIEYHFDADTIFGKTIQTLKIRNNVFAAQFNARIRNNDGKYILEIQKDRIRNNSRFLAILVHELTHLYELVKGYKGGGSVRGGVTSEDKLSYLLNKSEIDARINQIATYLGCERDNYESVQEFMSSKEFESMSRIKQIQDLINVVGKYKKEFGNYKQKLYRVISDIY